MIVDLQRFMQAIKALQRVPIWTEADASLAKVRLVGDHAGVAAYAYNRIFGICAVARIDSPESGFILADLDKHAIKTLLAAFPIPKKIDELTDDERPLLALDVTDQLFTVSSAEDDGVEVRVESPPFVEFPRVTDVLGVDFPNRSEIFQDQSYLTVRQSPLATALSIADIYDKPLVLDLLSATAASFHVDRFVRGRIGFDRVLDEEADPRGKGWQGHLPDPNAVRGVGETGVSRS